MDRTLNGKYRLLTSDRKEASLELVGFETVPFESWVDSVERYFFEENPRFKGEIDVVAVSRF